MTDSVKWGQGQKQRFVDFIDFELTFALGARQGLERQWREWLDQYRPSAKPALKRFPYEGAFGYTLPFTASDVDPMYASVMQTIHASEDLWTVNALNERWEPAAKPMQDFLTWLDHGILNMWSTNKRAILEMVQLGTAIYKHGWTYERRPYRTYDAQGKFQKVMRTVSRPFVSHVPLADFIMPPAGIAIQPDDDGGAGWLGERTRIDVQRLRSIANASDPMLPSIAREDLEKVLIHEERMQSDYRAKVADLDYVRQARQPYTSFDKDTAVGSAPGGVSGYVREIELYEIHARFPTQGESEDDIIVWYHRPTRIILRAIYQPFNHGARPYERVQYFPGLGFYGIGLCEQTELFQSLGSELFNYTGDNVLLVNSRMFATKSGSGIVAGEPVYPGKIFVTEGNPKDELIPMQMAEVYPSLPNLIQFLLQLKRERNGVSDLQRGNIESLPSRTPASSLQSLLAEGKRRPDLTIKDLRYSGLSAIGLRTIQNLQQMIGRPDLDTGQYLRLAIDVLGMPEGQLVAEKLMTPLEDAAHGLGVSISAISSTANKDLASQRAQNLLALSTTVGPQIIQMVQMAMQAMGTPLEQVALSAAKGTAELYAKVLEQEDYRNVEDLVPQVPEGSLAPMGVGAGPGAATGIPGPVPGLEGLLQGAGGALG